MTKAEILEVVRDAAREVITVWLDMQEEQKEKEQQKKVQEAEEYAKAFTVQNGISIWDYINQQFREWSAPAPFPWIEKDQNQSGDVLPDEGGAK